MALDAGAPEILVMRIAIIGSGLAGSVLADLLAGHVNVTVFERGEQAPQPPQPPEMAGHPFGLCPSFAYGLGGTTNYWHGGLIEMPDEEMGNAWPEALKSELSEFYVRVARHLYSEEDRRAWTERTHDRAGDFLYMTDQFHPDTIFRARNAGFVSMARLRTGCKVKRIEEKQGRLTVVSEKAGELNSEAFDNVILAAGGINSPLILKASGIGGPQVGRNLTDHPMGFVAKLKREADSPAYRRLRDKAALYGQSEATLKVRDDETGLTVAFYLRPAAVAGFPSDPYQRSFALLSKTGRIEKYLAVLPHLGDRDFLWQALENRLGIVLPSRYVYVLAVAEQEAIGQGDVDQNDEGQIVVNWKISDNVEGAIRRGLDRLAGYLECPLILPKGDLRPRLWSAAHHSGTCRIAEDPMAGVVDTDLRVHGTRNVYVCDGSVLPSTGGSNTGLTIAALAHRLARRIKDEVSSPTPHVRKQIFISGATGAVGRMVRARALELELPWQPVDLRSEPRPIETGNDSILLHLANASSSVQANVELQQRTTSFMARAKVRHVIVPMSGSTMLEVGNRGISHELENFGFTYDGRDPYPLGKLAAERFWIEWQSADSERSVTFIYIPTIVGPRSSWTSSIANHNNPLTLIVPHLDCFFRVSERDLCQGFANLFGCGPGRGVRRYFAMSDVSNLADAISSDRVGPMHTARLPDAAWTLIGLSNTSAMAGKLMSVIRFLADRILSASASRSVAPISPKYLHLFRRQSDQADVFMGARRLDEVASVSGVGPAKTADHSLDEVH